MKTYKQGFIALFFTLGVTSILMAYVAISSEHVFEYMYARNAFITSRQSIEADMQCADRYVNALIQIYALSHSFLKCTISNPSFVRENADIIRFSFTINQTIFKGTISHGRISELKSFYISL